MKIFIYFTLIIHFILGSCTSNKLEKTVNKPFSTEKKKVDIFTTSQNNDLRLSPAGTCQFKQADEPRETEVYVFVNPGKTFQTFTGIGGAITDASAEVFAKLPSQKQEEMLTAYYDKGKGIGYALVRTNMNSCDFSSDNYTYVSEGDKELKSFNIEHDKQFKIPLIKKAIQSAGGKLLLYVSPWSPPAFMKSNQNMLQGGKLLPEFNTSWAIYFTKFIKAYEAEGIPVWGLSIQNEPMAVQRWESCLYTAEEERDFLKNFLGPVLQQQGLGDKKIIVWDHNRDFLSQRANIILGDPEAAKYVWGIGFHWYEIWSGGKQMYDNVRNVYESFPDKNLIFTEGCAERFNPEHFQYWPNAERYGVSMINDFNNGTVAWTDWNILLDQNGGPNHKGNFCFAPLHANTDTGELIYTPSYYYIGHFSKFIQPGALRISTTCSRSNLLATSFLNPNGKIATIVLNQTESPVSYKLSIGSQLVEVEILSHSIQTLVY
jgi:glucosylceramidase